MNILLITLGTAGDVHPFVALGNELKNRKHRVTLATHDYFKPLADRFGLEFRSIGDAEHYQTILANPDIWNPARGFAILARELILGCMRPTYEIISRMKSELTVMVAPSYLFGARVAREKFAIPLVTVALQPSALWSFDDPPSVTSLHWEHWCPKLIRQLVAKGIETLYLERMLAPTTQKFRHELSLPSAKHISTQWLYSPDAVLGLFPEWFGPVPVDWPPQLRLCGFVSHEEQDPFPIPERCRSFLDAGEAPIAFTPGSGHQHAGRFFKVAVETCRLMGKRGILLTGFRGHLPQSLPEGIESFDYLPFSAVFPRCQAVVHHGGIGTTAKAMAAAVPQLIMPMAYDQPENASRLRALGVGDFIRPSQFSPGKVAHKLEYLVSSGEVLAQCQALSQKIDYPLAVKDACTTIEKVVHNVYA